MRKTPRKVIYQKTKCIQIHVRAFRLISKRRVDDKSLVFNRVKPTTFLNYGLKMRLHRNRYWFGSEYHIQPPPPQKKCIFYPLAICQQVLLLTQLFCHYFCPF